jgi:hypothetical protein
MMSRTVFAVMVKYSQLLDCFEQMMTEIEVIEG